MTCPTREELVLVLDSRLAPAPLAAARRHLAGCAACAGELARLEAGAAALRAGSPPREPSPWFSARLEARLARAPRRPGPAGLLRRRWPLLVASGVAAALAAGLFLRDGAPHAEELALAERLELLEDLEVVASVGEVENADDAEVILALDRLPPREGRP